MPANSAKNYAVVLLALTTIGGVALAWHQYQQIVELRASALLGNERADLQKKIWDLEKANRDLQAQIASLHNLPESSDEMLAGTNGDRPGNDQAQSPRGFRGRGGQFAAVFRDVMAKPEVQAMIATQQKAGLQAQYASLFKSLNLSSDQADKLTSLLADRQNAMRDVYQAARDQGVNPRTDPEGFAKLVADAESPINDSIKSLLGDSGYQQLSNYDQTMPQRNVVNVLQQRLANTDSPLSSTQADQLVQILASNAPQRAAPNGGAAGSGGPGGGGFGGRMGGMILGGFGGGGAGSLVGPNSAPITSGAVAQASGVLNQPQVTALQQLQQTQQTAQQLQQVMRSAWQQAAAGGETAANGSSPAGGNAGSGGQAGTGGGRRGGG